MNDFTNQSAESAKTAYQAEMFANRLKKQYKALRKWAQKERITSFRLYDRDIPEIPLAVDLYEFLPQDISDAKDSVQFLTREAALLADSDKTALADAQSRRYLHIALYERPYKKDGGEEEQWLSAMAEAARNVFGIAKENVVLKTRRKLSGTKEKRLSQYEKIEAERTISGIVMEQGELFYVNLTDYLDTGLFFDHRPLRAIVRAESAKKSVLNLFCYTGSFSVYAAEGGAARVESVDMSNTYLEWAKHNLSLNGFSDESRFVFTRSDVGQFLDERREKGAHYDLIILDPPTFSNSKKTSDTLDINRDWATLVSKSLALLSESGTLYFSSNSRRFSFDESQIVFPRLEGLTMEDISIETIPRDYRNTHIHRCWRISF